MKYLIKGNARKIEGLLKDYILFCRERSIVLEWNNLSDMKNAHCLTVHEEFLHQINWMDSTLPVFTEDEFPTRPVAGTLFDSSYHKKVFPNYDFTMITQSKDPVGQVNGEDVFETATHYSAGGVWMWNGNCWKNEFHSPIEGNLNLRVIDQNRRCLLAVVSYNCERKMFDSSHIIGNDDKHEIFSSVRNHMKKYKVMDGDTIPLVGTMGGYINV